VNLLEIGKAIGLKKLIKGLIQSTEKSTFSGLYFRGGGWVVKYTPIKTLQAYFE
jgi:hypothetical protein